MLAEGEAWLGEGLYLAQGWWAGPEGKAISFGEAVVEEGEETASERTSPRASWLLRLDVGHECRYYKTRAEELKGSVTRTLKSYKK